MASTLHITRGGSTSPMAALPESSRQDLELSQGHCPIIQSSCIKRYIP